MIDDLDLAASDYAHILARDWTRLRDRLNYNPFHAGIFELASPLSPQRPIWSLSFAEKPVQPRILLFKQIKVDDPRLLSRLGLPRQFEWLEIERELVNSLHDGRVLIERLYWINSPDSLVNRHYVAGMTWVREAVGRSTFATTRQFSGIPQPARERVEGDLVTFFNHPEPYSMPRYVAQY